ncbi:MAG: tail fiber domain-containing protein, partial [Saprospiraceae bacterium]
PSQLLTISEDNAPTFRLERSGTGRFDYEMYMNSADLRFRGGEDGTGETLTDFVTFASTGNVGIGTTNPAEKLHVNGNTKIEVDRSTFQASTFKSALDLQMTGTTPGLGGIILRYSDVSNAGGALIANDDVFGGIAVVRTNGSAFAPIDASAFNVGSDRRLKKGIKTIDAKNSSRYMNQIRKIESASFWYKTEAKRERPAPHIGVIAQTLPKELQVTMNESANGKGGKRLGVSLADWLGLVTIGVKENDRIVQQITEENYRLKEKVTALESKITALSAMVEKLLTEKTDHPKDANYELQLKKAPALHQNQPNPFNENTVVNYFIPETSKDAYIQVTTVEGKVLGKVNIQEKGNGQVTIKAATYPAGTYYYSLVVDGEVFETKRMVLSR